MAERIGVRELKNRASGIVRRVREEAAEYVITHHGRPVAVLRPIHPGDLANLQQQEALASLGQLLQLGEQLVASRVDDRTAREHLEAMRADEDQWPS